MASSTGEDKLILVGLSTFIASSFVILGFFNSSIVMLSRASYYVVVPLFMLVFDLISIIDPYYPWLYSLVPKEDC